LVLSKAGEFGKLVKFGYLESHFSRRNSCPGLDLRERILKDCDSGLPSEDAARKYSVSIASVYSWRKQRRETGSLAPKAYRRGQKPKLEPYGMTG